MDQTSLVERLAKAGEAVIRHLDKTDFTVQAALWFYFSETRDWKLIIASPYVAQFGPLASYRFIQNALNDLDNVSTLGIADIMLVSPEDELIQALGEAIVVGPELAAVRFTNNVINGAVIDDAYIYRLMTKPAGRPREKMGRAGASHHR